MSDRTVADDTLTPGASTTCWEPTGWAEPMYSVTTALKMAALRASSSPAACGLLVWSVVVGGRHGSDGVTAEPAAADGAGPRNVVLALHSSEC